MTEESWKRFKTLLKNASHAVAFTGAGVSTLSGIRDFRGKNGLYKQPETEKMFDTELFRRDPSIYYRLAKDFIYGLDEKQPCVVHRVLADWERKGILSAVITQNIDLLHQKAGSRRVIEVHGSPRFHFCLRCGERVPFKAAAETLGGVKFPFARSAAASSSRKSPFSATVCRKRRCGKLGKRRPLRM